MTSLLFGLVVGFSLGLTGGCGSIFAVPLLVYGLAMPAHEAVGVSLAAVGAADALAGFVQGPKGREGGVVNSSRGITYPAAAQGAKSIAEWRAAVEDAVIRAAGELRDAASA